MLAIAPMRQANPDLVLQTTKTAKNPVSSRNQVFNVCDRLQPNLQLLHIRNASQIATC